MKTPRHVPPDYQRATLAVRQWEPGKSTPDELLLEPMDISFDLQAECVRDVEGEYGLEYDVRSHTIELRPKDPDTMCYVAGLRVFNGPHEAIIEQICIGDGAGRYAMPFDAAAFNLGEPLPPLKASEEEGYRGEPLRFCWTDIGCFTQEHPLRISVRPWQAMKNGIPFEGFGLFDAFVVVQTLRTP